MAATREQLQAIAAKHDAEQALTDIDIFLDGTKVQELKDVGPSEAFPFLRAALLSASLGFDTEIQVSNIGVYEMMQAAFSDRTNVSVTLRGA